MITKKMHKIAMMLRLRLDGEGLNNEGNIGNVLKPRQIELKDGTVRNALSGEVLKHFHTKNLRLLAEDDELCSTCQIFSPMKNGAIKEADEELSESGNRTKGCLIDDIEGFMNAGNSKNEKRCSCIRLSWAIGTNESEYQSCLHTRVDPSEKGGQSKPKKNKKKRDEENDAVAATSEMENADAITIEAIDTTTVSAANSNEAQNTQMIFHRPIRSDEYAITIQVDLDRIGFDDEKLKYVFADGEDIRKRQKKCIAAIRNMFIDMEGALCSTRLPHIRDIKGIIVEKTDKNEVLSKYSALNDDFIEVNERISSNSVKFENIEEFVRTMNFFMDNYTFIGNKED